MPGLESPQAGAPRIILVAQPSTAAVGASSRRRPTVRLSGDALEPAGADLALLFWRGDKIGARMRSRKSPEFHTIISCLKARFLSIDVLMGKIETASMKLLKHFLPAMYLSVLCLLAMTVRGGIVFTNLVSFTGVGGVCPGGSPYSGLVVGADGNLYGTTTAGGSNNLGTVFQLTPGGSFTSLFSFNGTNGAEPLCRVDAGWQRDVLRDDVWRRSEQLGHDFSDPDQRRVHQPVFLHGHE